MLLHICPHFSWHLKYFSEVWVRKICCYSEIWKITNFHIFAIECIWKCNWKILDFFWSHQIGLSSYLACLTISSMSSSSRHCCGGEHSMRMAFLHYTGKTLRRQDSSAVLLLSLLHFFLSFSSFLPFSGACKWAFSGGEGGNNILVWLIEEPVTFFFSQLSFSQWSKKALWTCLSQAIMCIF